MYLRGTGPHYHDASLYVQRQFTARVFLILSKITFCFIYEGVSVIVLRYTSKILTKDFFFLLNCSEFHGNYRHFFFSFTILFIFTCSPTPSRDK